MEKCVRKAFGKPFHTAFLIFPGDAELLIEGVLCLNSEDDVSNYVGRMLGWHFPGDTFYAVKISPFIFSVTWLSTDNLQLDWGMSYQTVVVLLIQFAPGECHWLSTNNL